MDLEKTREIIQNLKELGEFESDSDLVAKVLEFRNSYIINLIETNINKKTHSFVQYTKTLIMKDSIM